MSEATDKNNFYSALNKSLIDPQSLAQQKQARDFFLDQHISAVPSEGNMLTLMTMRDLLGKDVTANDPKYKALKKIAEEESKFLTKAMEVLTTDTSLLPVSDAAERAKQSAYAKMQQKFGRDLRGAKELGQLIKSESLKNEWEIEMQSVLGNFNTKNADSWFAVPP